MRFRGIQTNQPVGRNMAFLRDLLQICGIGYALSCEIKAYGCAAYAEKRRKIRVGYLPAQFV